MNVRDELEKTKQELAALATKYIHLELRNSIAESELKLSRAGNVAVAHENRQQSIDLTATRQQLAASQTENLHLAMALSELKKQQQASTAAQEAEIEKLKKRLDAKDRELQRLNETKEVSGTAKLSVKAMNFLCKLNGAKFEKVFVTGSSIHGNEKDVDVVGVYPPEQIQALDPARFVFDWHEKHGERKKLYYNADDGTKYCYFYSEKLAKSLLEHAESVDFYCKALYTKRNSVLLDPTGKGLEHFDGGIIDVIVPEAKKRAVGEKAARRKIFEDNPYLTFRAIDAESNMSLQHGREFKWSNELHNEIICQIPNLKMKKGEFDSSHHDQCLHWILTLLSRPSAAINFGRLQSLGILQIFLPFLNAKLLPDLPEMQQNNIFITIQELGKIARKKVNEWILKLLINKHDYSCPIAFEDAYLKLLFESPAEDLNSALINVFLQKRKLYLLPDDAKETSQPAALSDWVITYLTARMKRNPATQLPGSFLQLLDKTSPPLVCEWLFNNLHCFPKDATFMTVLNNYYQKQRNKPAPTKLNDLTADLRALKMSPHSNMFGRSRGQNQPGNTAHYRPKNPHGRG